MGILALVLIIVGILLLLPGLFIASLKVLFWVGAVLVLLAVIAWAIRQIRGRDNTKV